MAIDGVEGSVVHRTYVGFGDVRLFPFCFKRMRVDFHGRLVRLLQPSKKWVKFPRILDRCLPMPAMRLMPHFRRPEVDPIIRTTGLDRKST